jgi:hypothetical protein
MIHPDFWTRRRVVSPSGAWELPVPSRSGMEGSGFSIVEDRQPSILFEGALLITGEVDRTSGFEQGMSIHQAWREDGWQPDPLILDDQALLLDVAGTLVVLTGCGHSGIINIIRYAKKLTGIDRLYAVIGGFHLTGGLFEPIIPPNDRCSQGRTAPGRDTGSLHAVEGDQPVGHGIARGLHPQQCRQSIRTMRSAAGDVDSARSTASGDEVLEEGVTKKRDSCQSSCCQNQELKPSQVEGNAEALGLLAINGEAHGREGDQSEGDKGTEDHSDLSDPGTEERLQENPLGAGDLVGEIHDEEEQRQHHQGGCNFGQSIGHLITSAGSGPGIDGTPD